MLDRLNMSISAKDKKHVNIFRETPIHLAEETHLAEQHRISGPSATPTQHLICRNNEPRFTRSLQSIFDMVSHELFLEGILEL